jgi:hypothetical protein
MTLLPTFITLGSAFAASSQPPSEEARQTAARVRASMLTQDWSWWTSSRPYLDLSKQQIESFYT